MIVTKTKVILLASFLITFAAGAVVGMLVSWPPPRHRHRPRLSEELGLSAQQQAKMRKIWSKMGGAPGAHRREGRRALMRERDEGIVALLNDEQLPQYKQIVGEYEQKLEKLHQERRQKVREAIELTKQMLTPEQAKKYEELMKRRPGAGRGFGPGRRPPGGPRSRRSDGQRAPRGEEIPFSK